MKKSSILIAVLQLAAFGTLLAMNPAYAQGLTKVNSTATMVQTLLASISVISGSIAFMWAGYKMMFQSAKWAEIANIVYGSVFVSGGTGLSAWLMV